MAPTRTTIDVVARAAGVSRQTVSNVVNAPERVGAATLERVREIIERLEYRPSDAARQMRTGRSYALSLRIEQVGDGINGSVSDRFVHALAESAQGAGFRILLSTAADEAAELVEYDELSRRHAIDGVVLTGTHHADTRPAHLLARAIPFTSFGRPWRATDATGSWVDVDGAAGTRLATERLLALGHRSIGWLGWPAGSDVGDDRRAGWRGALPDGLPVIEAASSDDVPSARAAVRTLLDRRVTAIVCASDTLAIAAQAEATARGLAVGADLSIVGFDDTPAARTLGLASVAQPLPAVARACIADVVAQLARETAGSGPSAEPVADTGTLLAPDLVEGPSLSVPPPQNPTESTTTDR